MRAAFDLLNRGRGRPDGRVALRSNGRGASKPRDREAREGVRDSGEAGPVENPGEATKPRRAPAPFERNSSYGVTNSTGHVPEADTHTVLVTLMCESAGGMPPSRGGRLVRTEEEALKGEIPWTDPDETLRGGLLRRRRRQEGRKTPQTPEPRAWRPEAKPRRTGTVEGRGDPMRGGRGRRPAETSRGHSLKGMQLRRGTRSGDSPAERDATGKTSGSRTGTTTYRSDDRPSRSETAATPDEIRRT